MIQTSPDETGNSFIPTKEEKQLYYEFQMRVNVAERGERAHYKYLRSKPIQDFQ